MITEKINEMVNEEVKKSIHEKLVELYEAKKFIREIEEKSYELNNENFELNRKLRSLTEAEDFITKFTPLVNKDNFEDFLDSLNLKGAGIAIDGMYSEDIPVWFRSVVKYYNHKELVTNLMNLFNIDYPDWATTFRLPYDYNEEELDLFFENINYAGMTNSEYFKHNIGFFYQKQRAYKGNVKSLLSKSDSFHIPLNLLLQNKLLVTDKYFNNILDKLENNYHSNSSNFFYIQEYQELSDYQVSQMLDVLPEGKLYDCHRSFIENNVDLFKIKPELVSRFLDKISDNQYSTFYYLNYPVDVQKDFVKNYNVKYGYKDKFEIVKKMKISKEEKIELLGEIAEIELDKQ